MSVSPLGSTLVVIRCSKLFRSWARAPAARTPAKTAFAANTSAVVRNLINIRTPLGEPRDRSSIYFQASWLGRGESNRELRRRAVSGWLATGRDKAILGDNCVLRPAIEQQGINAWNKNINPRVRRFEADLRRTAVERADSLVCHRQTPMQFLPGGAWNDSTFNEFPVQIKLLDSSSS